MEYDLFFLLQDEPALRAEKRKAATLAQRQRRGSLDPASVRRPGFQGFPQPQHHVARVVDDNERGGLFASVGRAFKSFAAGPSPEGGEWTAATVSPRRERRNSI